MVRITLQGAERLGKGEQKALRRMIKRLKSAVRADAVITCVVMTRKTIQQLNKQYRGKDRPTDVLSFGWPVGTAMVGDVFLCPSEISRTLKNRPGGRTEQIAHRFVHGVLHVLGYDHEQEGDARRMERLEKAVLGFDPY